MGDSASAQEAGGKAAEETHHLVRRFQYQAGSWDRPRRVVAKSLP